LITKKTNFDAGVSFLQQKKYEDAGRSFLKIKEESTVYAQSQWFFALSLLARDRYDTAKNILEDISNDGKNPFQEKAKILYSEILE
jgi:TolA-binding protein